MRWKAPVWGLLLILAGGCPLSSDAGSAQNGRNTHAEPAENEQADGAVAQHPSADDGSVDDDDDGQMMEPVSDDFIDAGANQVVDPEEDGGVSADDQDASNPDDAGTQMSSDAGEQVSSDAGDSTSSDQDAGPTLCDGGPCLHCEATHLGIDPSVSMKISNSSAEPIDDAWWTWTMRSGPAGTWFFGDVGSWGGTGYRFLPDVPGTYVWCGWPEGLHLGEACCEFTAFGPLELTKEPEWNIASLEDLEIEGGRYRVSFTPNQPVTPIWSTLSQEIKGQTFISTEQHGGTHDYDWWAKGNVGYVDGDAVMSGKELLQVGDTLTFKLDIVTSLSAEKKTIESSIVLGARPEPPIDTPEITDFEVDMPDLATITIHVRFAPDRPAGNLIWFGGWRLARLLDTDGFPVNDEGRAGDEVAGDGWYTFTGISSPSILDAVPHASGLYTVKPEPGSYDVLVRASDRSMRQGPSLRTTVVIK